MRFSFTIQKMIYENQLAYCCRKVDCFPLRSFSASGYLINFIKVYWVGVSSTGRHSSPAWKIDEVSQEAFSCT
jgi:hypothetical protein